MRRLISVATRSGCSRDTSSAAWPTTALPSSRMSTALGVSISPSRLGSVTGWPRSSRVAMAEKVVPRSMPTSLPVPPAILAYLGRGREDPREREDRTTLMSHLFWCNCSRDSGGAKEKAPNGFACFPGWLGREWRVPRRREVGSHVTTLNPGHPTPGAGGSSDARGVRAPLRGDAVSEESGVDRRSRSHALSRASQTPREPPCRPHLVVGKLPHVHAGRASL